MRHYIARRPRKQARLEDLWTAHSATISTPELGVFVDTHYWVNRADACASQRDREELRLAFLAAGSPRFATMQGFYVAYPHNPTGHSHPNAGYGDLYRIEVQRWVGPFTIIPVAP